ncbi:MAG TPA: helix-turn-helix domain-containing protein [Solirubrobacteraceae bacterium]|nr:helix-turn-helix domain-containing protein [Solirubrobacteraceae bacterium]
MLGKDYEQQDCSLARALEVIGERWTLLIVRDAFHGVRRFNDFQAHLDIPKAVLSDRLSGLVENGVLQRTPDPGHAGRHLYELTPAGRDLWPALHALLIWGGRHVAPNSRVFKHATCGSLLDEAGHCARCGVTPGPQDIVSEVRRSRTRGRAAPREDAVAVALREPHRLLEPLGG